MSKTTVRKAIECFDATELRQLILDVYSKSKEAKEILDFYAVPDIAKKIEEYEKPIFKEVWRYARRAHRPRMPRIKALIKKFSILDPGDEAIGRLRAFTMIEFCKVAADEMLKDSTNEAIDKFFRETLDYLGSRMLFEEYEPQFEKAIRQMHDFRFYSNTLKSILGQTLAVYQKKRASDD